MKGFVLLEQGPVAGSCEHGKKLYIFRKVLWIFWGAEELLASQGLSSMELVRTVYIQIWL
jgi:hypothetical protein